MQLKHLDFEMNYFEGSLNLKAFESSKKSLQRLRMSFNMITGSIDEEVGDFIQLQELWLAGNNFVGTIPLSLQSLTKLGKHLLMSISSSRLTMHDAKH